VPEDDTVGQQAPSQLPPAPDAAAAAEAQQKAAEAAAARVAYEEDQVRCHCFSRLIACLTCTYVRVLCGQAVRVLAKV
jgi:hypothetical protein